MADDSIRAVRQVGSWLEVDVDHRGEQPDRLTLNAPGGSTEVSVAAGIQSTVLLDVPPGNQALAEVAATLVLRDVTGREVDRESTHLREPVALPNGPLLALSGNVADALRQRFQNDIQVNHVLTQQVLLVADAYLAAPLPVPTRSGAWAGSGNDPDGVRAAQEHAQLAETDLILALAYTLTGRTDYAQAVADMLLEYARLYPGWPLHDRTGASGGQRLLPDAARMMAQTLDEARLLLDHARAFDLIRGAGVLDAGQSEQITEAFLRPSAQLLRNHHKGIHNIQCWLNAAAFLAFVQSHDPVGAADCLEGEFGFHQILDQGIGKDGTWVEASFMYHFFAAEALLPMARALENLGLSYDRDRLRSMFESPYTVAGADGTLPMINDGVHVGLADEGVSKTSLVEQGFALLGGDDVSQALRRWGRGRDYRSVVFGWAELPEDPPVDPPDAIQLRSLGIAMLRVGPLGIGSSLAIDYGPHGGDHGHPDKLSLHAWLGGRPAIGEASTNLYGSSLYRNYFKRTLAHSTVLVNGSDQQPSRGTLVAWDRDDKWVECRADKALPGCSLVRRSHLTPDGFLIDLFRVSGGSGSADFVVHCYGDQVTTDAAFQTAANAGYPGDSAYDTLQNVRSLTTGEDVDLTFADARGAHTVRIPGVAGSTLLLADAPWFDGTLAPVLIVRRPLPVRTFGLVAVDGDRIPADLLLQWDLPQGKVHYTSAGQPAGFDLQLSP